MKSPAEEMFCFNNLQLAVHPVKGWIVSKHGEEYVLRDQQLNEFLVWLPLLEADVTSFIRFADGQSYEFPFISLLNVAVTSNSPYWVNLSIPWMEALAERLDLSDLREPIRKCIKNTSNPQDTRHRFMKILSRLESKNTMKQSPPNRKKHED